MQTDIDAVKDALPLVGIGLAGGAIRAINQRPFSLRDMCVRLCTAGFTSSLALMALSITDYPRPFQGFVTGAAGVLGIDLLNAARCWLYKKLTGVPVPPETAPYILENEEGEYEGGPRHVDER